MVTEQQGEVGILQENRMLQENQRVALGKAALSASGLWLACGLGALLWLYRDVVVWLVNAWSTDADYSHGYFVPVFAAYVLWANRRALGTLNTVASKNSGILIGIGLMTVGLLMRAAGIYMRVQTYEGLSLLPFLLGVLTIVLGRAAVRWAVPAVLFLVFMYPLPGFLANELSGLLQMIATQMSTFTLQTLGVPAFAEGNIISLASGQIGVAEACSGLRMLYAFFALTVGACMVVDRHWYEKVVIALTAIPIAIVCNCIRIVVTGLAYEYLDAETAHKIFHDVAGWLMMPMGFAILLGVLSILDRAIVPEDEFSAYETLQQPRA